MQTDQLKMCNETKAESIGAWLKRRRLELGLSLKETAIDLEFKDSSYLSKIEYGRNVPTDETIVRLAKVLRVSTKDIYIEILRLKLHHFMQEFWS